MSLHSITRLVLFLLFIVSSAQLSHSRKIKQKPNSSMLYHKGAILKGDIPLEISWYGEFTSTQKSILVGFLSSLTPNGISTSPAAFGSVNSVAQWWDIVNQEYVGNAKTNIYIDNQSADQNYTSGKTLTLAQISQIASKSPAKAGGITLVFTSADVAVEGFGMSRCGAHGVDPNTGSVWIWVGNPETQCPGQCAWPFAKPVYGPTNPPLGSPNREVGADAMVITTATLLSNTVTDPKGDAFYAGEMKLEVGTLCSGKFGPGAYVGYPGKTKTDSSTGGSYNAQGTDGKKYLLPALYSAKTSSCYTMG